MMYLEMGTIENAIAGCHWIEIEETVVLTTEIKSSFSRNSGTPVYGDAQM